MTSDENVHPPVKKRSRKLLYGGLAVLLVCAGFIGFFTIKHYSLVKKRGEYAWSHMPSGSKHAIEVRGVHEIFDELQKDGLVREVLAVLSGQGARIPDHAVFSGLRNLDPRILGSISKYADANPHIRAILTPETILLGMCEDFGDDVPFAVVSMPWWLEIALFFMPYNEGTIYPFGDSGAPLHAAHLNGWCVVSPSFSLVERIVSEWDKSNHELGDLSGLASPFVAFSMKTGEASDDAGAEQVDNNENPFLSGMASFDFSPPVAREPAGQIHVLATLRQKTWDVRGIWRRDDDRLFSENGFALPDSLFPPPHEGGGMSPPRTVALAVTVPMAGPEGFLGLLDSAFAEPEPRVDHPLAVTSWLWLRRDWLEQATGDFVFHAADPDREKLAGKPYPTMPVLTLGWKTGGDHREAVGRFEAGSDLFFESLLAPGGPLPLQTLKNAAKIRRLRNSFGEGLALGLPSVFAYSAEPAWLMSAPREGGTGTGFFATDPSGLPNNEIAAFFDRPLFSRHTPASGGDLYQISGVWSSTDLFRGNLVRILNEAAPVIGNASSRVVGNMSLAVAGLDLFLDLYPAGAISAFHDPVIQRSAMKVDISRVGRNAAQ